MARVGKNPARSVKEVPKPKNVTIAIIFYAPNLTGYFTETLDVLKVCIESIQRNTDCEYDLMIFDNGSCEEVREYFLQLEKQGVIQYLILSSKNIGKVAAWNFIFAAAPGKYIAYADSDIFFHPGWLSKSLKIFQTFRNVGTVTGCPLTRVPTYYSNTIKSARFDNDVTLEEGKFIPIEWMEKHMVNAGQNFQKFLESSREMKDYRLISRGTKAYANSGHFQFIIRSDVAKKIIPLEVKTLVAHNEELLDEAINNMNYLRLATEERLTEHIGNTVSQSWVSIASEFGVLSNGNNIRLETNGQASLMKKISQFPLVKRVLIGSYNRIFELYYN